MKPSLMTAREVATYLHVHPNTVKRLVKRGALSHYRIGTRGDLRFSARQVAKYLGRWK